MEPQVDPKVCTNPCEVGSGEAPCGHELVEIPWPYGYEADPIEVCPECDWVGQWPSSEGIQAGTEA